MHQFSPKVLEHQGRRLGWFVHHGGRVEYDFVTPDGRLWQTVTHLIPTNLPSCKPGYEVLPLSRVALLEDLAAVVERFKGEIEDDKRVPGTPLLVRVGSAFAERGAVVSRLRRSDRPS